MPIWGGGAPIRGAGMAFQPVPAEFNHCMMLVMFQLRQLPSYESLPESWPFTYLYIINTLKREVWSVCEHTFTSIISLCQLPFHLQTIDVDHIPMTWKVYCEWINVCQLLVLSLLSHKHKHNLTSATLVHEVQVVAMVLAQLVSLSFFQKTLNLTTYSTHIVIPVTYDTQVIFCMLKNS